MKATIIGSGVYGKAMANVLLQAKCEITMWTEQKDFEKVEARDEIRLTNSYEEAAKFANIIFVLTGSKFVPSILKNLSPHISSSSIIVLGSKGLLSDGTILTDLAKDILPNDHYAVISGPTFAKDIAALDPVGFTVATHYEEDYMKIKQCLSGVHLEYSSDVLAIEMAGSLKNAYAIGSGMIRGMNYGHSTTCLYITEALKEMTNIFVSLGSLANSTNTLAGVGDFVLTCTSSTSRNFTFGTLFATSLEKANEYLEQTTVEGYENLKAYMSLFAKKSISVPIMHCVADIVSGIKKPEELIKLLLK